SLTGDNLFGGTDKEGGISGNIAFYRGIPTQLADAYLTAKTGRQSAIYPTLCYAVMKGLYVGTSSYVKPIAFVVQRCPDPFTQGAPVAQINNAADGADANPALAIYDLMTSTTYGLGIPAAKFDVNVWKAAATTLANEGLGISMQFDSQSSADNLIGEILR